LSPPPTSDVLGEYEEYVTRLCGYDKVRPACGAPKGCVSAYVCACVVTGLASIGIGGAPMPVVLRTCASKPPLPPRARFGVHNTPCHAPSLSHHSSLGLPRHPACPRFVFASNQFCNICARVQVHARARVLTHARHTHHTHQVLPMNTGVEGGETACKLARRWGYAVKVRRSVLPHAKRITMPAMTSLVAGRGRAVSRCCGG
jgi:hypothetical protein